MEAFFALILNLRLKSSKTQNWPRYGCFRCYAPLKRIDFWTTVSRSILGLCNIWRQIPNQDEKGFKMSILKTRFRNCMTLNLKGPRNYRISVSFAPNSLKIILLNSARLDGSNKYTHDQSSSKLEFSKKFRSCHEITKTIVSRSRLGFRNFWEQIWNQDEKGFKMSIIIRKIK